MALEIMRDDVRIIQGLSDYPNQEEGLSSGQMKAKFDEAAVMLQSYINNSVVPAVNDKLSASELSGAVADAVEQTLGSITPDKIGAAPASHVSDKNNPHGVTADQIGAAPAGYGLGAGGKAIASGDDLNNYKVGGFYQFTSGVANAPTNYGIMLVIPGTGYSNDTFQYVFSRYPTNIMYLRQLFSGTWGPWECINPPMTEGVEYRTTERYKGKPVYALLKNLGAMPNSTTKTIYDLANNVDNLVSADLTLDKGEARHIDNKFTELRWYIGCYSNPYIEISSTNDKSGYTGFLRMKYTKSTD
jgi:hypothetical protein